VNENLINWLMSPNVPEEHPLAADYIVEREHGPTNTHRGHP
jgi:hypothetical protein